MGLKKQVFFEGPVRKWD